jgi:hypothetical protein
LTHAWQKLNGCWRKLNCAGSDESDGRYNEPMILIAVCVKSPGAGAFVCEPLKAAMRGR